MTRPTILLAGGGTGGHVFPLVAVADALRDEADVRVVYVGTARGLETRVVPARGDELELLDVVPIKGGGVTGALKGVTKAALALPRARALVGRLSPAVVLSAGGYAAGPVALAAWSAGVPVALLEPNGVLGLANRWLRPLVRRAYVAFPEVEAAVGERRALRTGVPLRRGFAPIGYRAVAGRMRVVVLGGSQGALALDRTLPEALGLALRETPGLDVLHQCGKGREAEVRAAYERAGVAAEVVPFIDDVAGALAGADVVVGRAGAGFLAELCVVGRASILVPFPFAADDHQRRNAESLAAEGAATCIVQSEASAERLAGAIVALGRDVEARTRMAVAAGSRGRPDAARDVARDLLTLGGIGRRAVEPTSDGAARTRGSITEAAHV